MEIVIDFYSNKPIYEQIAEQIKSEIHLGKIGVGDPLPSIRALAGDLNVSVITTKRVYEILERDGYIRTLPQRGSFVADTSGERFDEEIRRSVTKRVCELIEYARSYGVSEEDLKNIFESEILNDD